MLSPSRGEPYLALEYIGTVTYAASGGAVAVRAGMDWLGVAVLAVVAAVGGGTARNLLLGRLPVGSISDPWQVCGWLLILVGQTYALSAAAGATVLVVLGDAHAPPQVASWTAIAVAVLLWPAKMTPP